MRSKEVRYARRLRRPPFRPVPSRSARPDQSVVWLSLPAPVQQRALQTLGRILSQHLVIPPVAKEVHDEQL
jgi:hypothetical protein